MLWRCFLLTCTFLVHVSLENESNNGLDESDVLDLQRHHHKGGGKRPGGGHRPGGGSPLSGHGGDKNFEKARECVDSIPLSEIKHHFETRFQKKVDLKQKKKNRIVQKEAIGCPVQRTPGSMLARLKKPSRCNQKGFDCQGSGFLNALEFISERCNLKLLPAKKIKELLEGLNRRIVGDERFCGLNEGCFPEKCGETTRCSSEDLNYRRSNGTCNNVMHPLWGSANIEFRRAMHPVYSDGVSGIRNESYLGGLLSSPRRISVETSKDFDSSSQAKTPHSNLMTIWGQFLDHDMSITPEVEEAEDETPIECCEDGTETQLKEDVKDPNCCPLDVRADAFYQNENHTISCLRYVRSLPFNRGCRFGLREQLNQNTIYLDASQVYGSSDESQMNVRSSLGGKLKTNNLTEHATNTSGREVCTISNCPYPFLPTEIVDSNTRLFAGDARVEENSYLISMHTLWLRVHNGLAEQIAKVNDLTDDEQIFQETRRVVESLYQSVIFGEFLPILLGKSIMKKYRLNVGDDYQYNPTIDASADNVFAAAAFRYGHTMILDDISAGPGERTIRLHKNFAVTHFLFDTFRFWFPSKIYKGNTFRGSNIADRFLVEDLTNLLFAGNNSTHGLDLLALNIKRGRDHGIPPYYRWKMNVDCVLKPPSSFDDLSDVIDKDHIKRLMNVYKDVRDIDLFVAAIAEKPLGDGLLGPTLTCLIKDQFVKLKFGDRFYHENQNQNTLRRPLLGDQMAAIKPILIAELMCVHSTIAEIQRNAFMQIDDSNNREEKCTTIKNDGNYMTLIKKHFNNIPKKLKEERSVF